jgi:hypothetical protein
MDSAVEIDSNNQGITIDERKYLCQIFDNIVQENLAVSDSYGNQIVNEGRKQ